MTETMRLPNDHDSLHNFCASLLGLYVFAVEIDLTTGLLKTVAGESELCRRVDSLSSCHGLIRRLNESYIHESFRPAVEMFLDVQNIKNRLRDRDFITLDFLGTDQKRYSANLVPTHRQKHGNVGAVYLLIRKSEERGSETPAEEPREEEWESDEMNSRLETLLSGIAGGFRICRNEKDFGFVYVSEGVAAIQGYTVGELLRVSGGSLKGCVYPADAASVFSEIRRQYEQGDTYRIRYRVVHKDGSLRWVSDTGKRVTAKDGSILHYSLIQDITATKRSVDTLHDLFAMQRQMVEAIGSGLICYTFPEKELILSNDEACRIIGCDVGDDPIEGLSEFLTHRVISENRSMSSSEAQPEHPGDFRLCEYRVRSRSGEIWRIKYSSRLLKLENGEMIAVVNLTDLTEQARIASMLSRERVQYRDALTTNCEYTFRLDMTEGVVLADDESHALERFAEGLGITFPYDYDRMMGLWEKHWQPQLLTPHAGELLSCRGLLSLYVRGNRILEMEYYIPRQERYYRWIMLLSAEEGSGHKTAVVIIHDFTELHREAEQKRAELEELYASREEKLAIIGALGNIYYCIYYVDLSLGSFSIVSGVDYFAKYSSGDSSAARTALNWIERGLGEEFREELTEFVDLSTLAARMKDVPILSRECVSKVLGWIRVSFIAANRDDAGNVTQVLWTVQHIDQEKQRELDAKAALQEAYEAANRANAAKTDFLASMSHNLRTPMNAVIGMTAIAGTHLNDPERIEDCLSKINGSSHRLLGLINEILDMNKIESGKLDFNEEECNLSELVDQLLAAARPQIDEKHHAFSVSIPRLTHENVIGDSGRILQMLMNLLDNAVKYTPPGGEIRLTITEQTTHREKVGCYEFVIEDNGIGMSAEYLPRLYEPFTRAKDPRVEKIHGTGLGMAIAQNIAAMMNGDIKTESVPEKGTKVTATVFLELCDCDDGFRPEMLRKRSAQPSALPLDGLTRESFAGVRALLAEDNELNAEIATEILKMLGLEVEYVKNGKAAFDRIRTGRSGEFDIIFMDIQMPEMNGYEATRAIRALPGEYAKTVPILAMSANAFAEDVHSAKEAGMNEHIAKPLDFDRLQKALNCWLK